MSFLGRLGIRATVTDENARTSDPRRRKLFHMRGRLSSLAAFLAARETPTFRWELCVDPSLDFGARVEVGDEDDIEGHVKVFGCALYWGVDGVIDRRKRRIPHRELRVSVHDGTIYWCVWKDPHSWSRADGWRNSWWNFKDAFLGKAKYSSEVVEKREVLIPLPEGSYPAKVELSLDRWERPRWRTEVVKRAHIDVEKGLPFPGKGENSYDCGDDAIYGSTFPSETVEEAIGHMVASTLRNRWRYGRTHKWEKNK